MLLSVFPCAVPAQDAYQLAPGVFWLGSAPAVRPVASLPQSPLPVVLPVLPHTAATLPQPVPLPGVSTLRLPEARTSFLVPAAPAAVNDAGAVPIRPGTLSLQSNLAVSGGIVTTGGPLSLGGGTLPIQSNAPAGSSGQVLLRGGSIGTPGGAIAPSGRITGGTTTVR